MKPYEQRSPDTQYRECLQAIVAHGELVGKTPQGVGALTVFGELAPMVFDLSEDVGNGFPMITERSVKGFWKMPIAEIFAFINGVRTLEGLEEFGCRFWSPWGTEVKCAKRGLVTGDLGPGSYGGAFHDFPTVEGELFNQFAHILRQIQERPELRTHFISPWIPQYTIRVEGRQQKVVVCPCHGWVSIRIINGTLRLLMFQRSADMVVGVPANMIQYAALTMALAHVTGYKVGKYCHLLGDAHIYTDQLDQMNLMIGLDGENEPLREPRQLPTVELVDPPDDLFAFRPDNFALTDYDPHPAIPDIPVGI